MIRSIWKEKKHLRRIFQENQGSLEFFYTDQGSLVNFFGVILVLDMCYGQEEYFQAFVTVR